MNTDFITPIQVPESWTGIRGASSMVGTEETEEKTNLFKDLFNDIMTNVNETEENAQEQEYLLATGQIDDVHNITIAEAQAQLAVDMLVQLRNHAVEAYNEIMRISL